MAPSPPSSDCTLALLAGGAGSRMGRPKSLLTLGGRPILEYLHDRFAFPGPTLLITAPGRERPPGHERFDAERADPHTDGGPLLGLHTAATHATTELVLVVAVDMPEVTSEGCGPLLAALRDTPALAFAMYGDGSDEVQPLPLALRVSLALPILSAHLAERRLSLKSLAAPRYAAGGVTRVLPVPDDLPAAFWTNLNYPHDLPS